MVEKLKFGTLCMDGQPQENGGWYPTSEPSIRLGNTVPGGWRPALEFQADRDIVPGDQVLIKLKHGWVRGVLLEKTDYDLLLKAIPATPLGLLKAEGCLLLDQGKGLAAVERQAILDIQIEEE